MGDGINLASRLEGANKFWKTQILASGETVAKLAGRVPMRRVDRVRVSGKTRAGDVYTPSDDRGARSSALTAAFEAYLNRDWDTAARLYGEMLDGESGRRRREAVGGEDRGVEEGAGGGE